MISFGNSFKEEVAEGVRIAAKAIKSTYGPLGSYTALKSSYGAFKFTKDGYSVANTLEDHLKNSYSGKDIGIKSVVECSRQINQLCGDSTTTVVVLYSELVNQLNGLNLDKTQLNKLISELESDLVKITSELESKTKLVESLEELTKVARTSSNGSGISDLISELVWKVGNHKVSVSPSTTNQNFTEIIEGVQFAAQCPSSLLSNRLVKPKVLVTNKVISTFEEVSPFLNKCTTNNYREILIVCDDITPSVLAILAGYQERGMINCTVLRNPMSDLNARNAFFRDLAVVFGTKLLTNVTQTSGIDEFLESAGLGECDLISFNKNDVNIILTEENQAKVGELVKSIKAEVGQNEYYENIKDSRIEILEGSVGTIYLAADTEYEFRELRDRVEDAINSCKNVMKYGYSPGGGYAYKNLECLDSVHPMLKSALSAPRSILPECDSTEVVDPTFSLVSSIRVALSMLVIYAKLDFAVVNTDRSLLDGSM